MLEYETDEDVIERIACKGKIVDIRLLESYVRYAGIPSETLSSSVRITHHALSQKR
jgi:hypothetical protein